MDSGELCVMTILEALMLTQCANNWGTTLPMIMTTSPSETNSLSLQDTCVHVHCLFCRSRGNSSQPIWLDDVYCSYTHSCITGCQRCSFAEHSDCSHSKDITVECCE